MKNLRLSLNMHSRKSGIWLVLACLVACGSASAQETTGVPAETIHPDNVMQLVELAQEAFDEERFQDALKIAEAALMLNPDHEAAADLALRIRKRLAKDRLDAALKEKEISRIQAIGDIEEKHTLPEEQEAIERPMIPESVGLDRPTGENIEEKLNQKVSMNLTDADLSYVLDLLFRCTGVNIIANHADMAGIKLSLHVDDISLSDLLEYLAQNVGLAYTLGSDSVWLSTAANPLLEHAIFHLNVGLTSTAGEIKPDADNDVTRVLTWMESWPNWPPGSTWSYDYKTNTLFVLSTRGMLKNVDEVVRAIDIPPVQVSIEARFVTVGVDDLRELGLDWELTSDSTLTKRSDGQTGMQVDQGTGVDLNDFTQSGLTFALTGVLTDPEFTAVLHALDDNQDTNTLSVPQVTVLNNETAELHVGEQFPVPTEYRELNAITTTDNQNTSVPTGFIPIIETIDLGATLKVTPSVGRDRKTITLQLEPEILELVRFVEYSGVTIVDGNAEDLPGQQYPVIEKRTVKTRLVVADGSTVVMGGLIDEVETVSQKKVPLLGDVPVLGWLFKSETTDSVKSNLLIFVTAKIVTPTGRGYQPEQVEQHFNGKTWDELVTGTAPSVVETVEE